VAATSKVVGSGVYMLCDNSDIISVVSLIWGNELRLVELSKTKLNEIMIYW
jgi:hypothetical protein